MAALLLVGSTGSIRIDDHRTRSRRFLQRGLLLSGLIHLSLLFVFLSLTNRSDEGLVRLISSSTEIFLPPETKLRQVPPPLTDAGAASTAEGVIQPVDPRIDPGAIELPPDVVFGAGDPKDPIQGSANARRTGGESGPPQAPTRDIYKESEVDDPPVAREMYFTGRVVLRVLVGEDGNVRKVEVVSGPRLLSESAQETLYRWRFRPARFQGRPVSVWLEVPVNFVMNGG
jgi:periplasmic protein TonB